jgi:DNA-binding CsgD family transcriptional regulator
MTPSNLARPLAAPLSSRDRRSLVLLPSAPAGPDRWSELLHAFHLLGYAVAICDEQGRVRHATPAMRALLDADAPHGVIDASLRRIRQPSVAGATLATANGAQRLRVLPAAAREDDGGHYVVLLEALAPALPAAGEIQARFGLTPAEARVALLIAQGSRNAGVATALSISPHTAKRHTERVLQKLGVASRSLVAERLRSARDA